MKFIIFLAFLAVSNGAPTPSDEDHVVNKPIGHDDVHIPDNSEIEDILAFTQRTVPISGGRVEDDGPVREDIVSHETKRPLVGHDGHGILHTTQKPLLGHDGHGIRHTTSAPEGHLHGGIVCATETPDGPKDESLFGFGHTIVPPFVDPELSRGKLPLSGGIKIADIIKDHAKTAQQRPAHNFSTKIAY